MAVPIYTNNVSDGGGLVTKSCLTLVTPWTIAHQAPLSIGFSRQEYWSGWLFPSPRDLPNPGVKATSPALAGRFFTTEHPEKSVLSGLWGPRGGSRAPCDAASGWLAQPGRRCRRQCCSSGPWCRLLGRQWWTPGGGAAGPPGFSSPAQRTQLGHKDLVWTVMTSHFRLPAGRTYNVRIRVGLR